MRFNSALRSVELFIGHFDTLTHLTRSVGQVHEDAPPRILFRLQTDSSTITVRTLLNVGHNMERNAFTVWYENDSFTKKIHSSADSFTDETAVTCVQNRKKLAPVDSFTSDMWQMIVT